MARYSASARAAGAGSTALPSSSLYATATVIGKIREIGVSNTTATAVAIAVMRLTTTGTRGSTLTPAKHQPLSATASVTAYNTHTAGPTLGNEICRTVLGGAVGSSIIWTFGDEGLVIAEGTAAGVGIICSTGTGQIVDFYFVWDE